MCAHIQHAGETVFAHVCDVYSALLPRRGCPHLRLDLSRAVGEDKVVQLCEGHGASPVSIQVQAAGSEHGIVGGHAERRAQLSFSSPSYLPPPAESTFQLPPCLAESSEHTPPTRL